MNQRRADEQPAAQQRFRQAEGQQTGKHGDEDEGENHFDCRLLIADCRLETNWVRLEKFFPNRQSEIGN